MAISKELRVGVFLMLGLLVTGAVVFLIGDEKRLFDSKVRFFTSFSDVQGLKVGASARLGGIDIGTVSRVRHNDDPADTRLHVELSVVKSEAPRIHQDAIARIVNKGLLGDKMIEIEGGTTRLPVLPPGGNIKGEDPADLMSVFHDVSSMAEKAQSILGNLEATSRTLADATLQDDLRSSVHSLSVLLKTVAQGNGYVHRLLVDPEEANRVSHLVANMDRASTELAGLLAESRKVVARVNQGPGTAHDLVYEEQGAKALAQAGAAADELGQTLHAIREGTGPAHALLYGGNAKADQLVENLGAMGQDLRQIVSDLRAGKGTLGALLVDPSVYEDVKAVLGNVQRNDALRALVRYSIKQDEKRPSTKVEGAQPPAGPRAEEKTGPAVP